MGYYASGEGKAKLKQNVNIENLVADIERIYGEGSIGKSKMTLLLYLVMIILIGMRNILNNF